MFGLKYIYIETNVDIHPPVGSPLTFRHVVFLNAPKLALELESLKARCAKNIKTVELKSKSWYAFKNSIEFGKIDR